MNYFKERFNKRFVKNGIKAVSFVLVIAVILLALSPVFMPKTNKDLRDKSAQGFLAEPDNSIDVLFVGSSLAYSSMIPLKLFNDYGIISYVCGTPSQPLSYSEDFIRRVFKNQKPQLVVLETDGVFIRGYSTAVSLCVEEWCPVFRYHDRWKKLSSNDFSSEFKGDYIVNDKGYRLFGGIESADTGNYKKATKKKAHVPFLNKFFLESIKKLCEENGAELMFVSIPSVKDWSYERHNAAAELSESLGIEYIDMNMMPEEVPIDWSLDSRDGGKHLSQSGAEKVTSYFGKYLDSKNIFKDYRDDNRFDYWKQAYTNFLKKADKINAEDKQNIEHKTKKTKSL